MKESELFPVSGVVPRFGEANLFPTNGEIWLDVGHHWVTVTFDDIPDGALIGIRGDMFLRDGQSQVVFTDGKKTNENLYAEAGWVVVKYSKSNRTATLIRGEASITTGPT